MNMYNETGVYYVNITSSYFSSIIVMLRYAPASPGVGVASEVGVVLVGGVAGGGCGVTSGISYVASVSSVAGCGPLVLPLPITSYS